MSRRFVVVSGLPGSGKSTLARRLASALRLPVIDKDDILERLFASKGIGDAAWRRILSRESDEILQAEALASSEGAILVSFWRQAGMPLESGTPVDWLRGLADRVIHVHCACDPETAARRFFERQRHPGHLDGMKSYAEVLAGIRALADLEPLEIGAKVIVDTSLDTNTKTRLDEAILLL
jgi:gluconate kinase